MSLGAWALGERCGALGERRVCAVCGARRAAWCVRGVMRTVWCVGSADWQRVRSGSGRRRERRERLKRERDVREREEKEDNEMRDAIKERLTNGDLRERVVERVVGLVVALLGGPAAAVPRASPRAGPTCCSAEKKCCSQTFAPPLAHACLLGLFRTA